MFRLSTQQQQPRRRQGQQEPEQPEELRRQLKRSHASHEEQTPRQARGAAGASEWAAEQGAQALLLHQLGAGPTPCVGAQAPREGASPGSGGASVQAAFEAEEAARGVHRHGLRDAHDGREEAAAGAGRVGVWRDDVDRVRVQDLVRRRHGGEQLQQRVNESVLERAY